MGSFKMCLADNLQDASDCGGLDIAFVLMSFKVIIKCQNYNNRHWKYDV